MTLWRIWGVLLLISLGFLSPRPAFADDGRESSGLPGVGRVASASAANAAKHVGASLNVGYGYLEALVTSGASGGAQKEAQPRESGGHQRLLGTIGLMAQPLPFLAAALTLDGRFDTHPNDALGTSTTVVGEPRLFLRANQAVAESFALGAQLVWLVPGAEAPSIQFDASTLDAIAIATYTARAIDLGVSLNAGYRRDGSARVLDGQDRRRLRRGDRISLDASDFDAALLGLGVSKRFGKVEGLADFSADLLLGKHAPSMLESPLRIGIGARYHLREAIQLEARPELGLSGRPGTRAADPLAPMDPRFVFTIGVRWTPAFGEKAKPPAPAPPPPPVVVAETKPPPTGIVRGKVSAEKGEPITAQVTIIADDVDPALASVAADGTFALAGVRAGAAHVVATAPGYDKAEANATIDPRIEAVVTFVLKKTIRPGQLRGLVRSFNSTPLAATIKIDPIGTEVKTDADGMFQVDVPPGAYDVDVTAAGFAHQRRHVQVEENGVTVLNADLRPTR